MLKMATNLQSVVLVDEIENGIYYKHKVPIWRGILDLARNSNSQMFLSTHDEEWLNALVEADTNGLDDVAIWRLERTENGVPVLKQFTGSALKASSEFDGDIR